MAPICRGYDAALPLSRRWYLAHKQVWNSPLPFSPSLPTWSHDALRLRHPRCFDPCSRPRSSLCLASATRDAGRAASAQHHLLVAGERVSSFRHASLWRIADSFPGLFPPWPSSPRAARSLGVLLAQRIRRTTRLESSELRRLFRVRFLVATRLPRADSSTPAVPQLLNISNVIGSQVSNTASSESRRGRGARAKAKKLRSLRRQH